MERRWHWSSNYLREFQTDEQILHILQLLQIDDAANLADVGCGNGRLAVEAALRYPGLLVAAVDLANDGLLDCLHFIREHCIQGAYPVRADATSLPFRSGFFDRLLARNVCHLVPTLSLLVKELRRIGHIGTRLVFEGPASDRDESFGKALTSLHWVWKQDTKRFYYTREAIMTTLKDNGFSIVSFESWRFGRLFGLPVRRFIEDLPACSGLEWQTTSENGGEVRVSIPFVRVVGLATS